ncbi:nucleoside-triphosphatase, RNA helicase [Pseudoloma neurophilia]|uniref:Nucleoside-triphosphatase, RNA helicase n=1 Tax=Pseudoloma neurophilia TaxID=146866 RepID=A0A0R0M662_9MICR|nr:nucleoside-triphosphatase, RNA helicase [Pseudoloma neurophilia]
MLFEEYQDKDFHHIKKNLQRYDSYVIERVEILLKGRHFDRLEEALGWDVSQIVIKTILSIQKRKFRLSIGQPFDLDGPNHSDDSVESLSNSFKGVSLGETPKDGPSGLTIRYEDGKPVFHFDDKSLFKAASQSGELDRFINSRLYDDDLFERARASVENFNETSDTDPFEENYISQESDDSSQYFGHEENKTVNIDQLNRNLEDLLSNEKLYNEDSTYEVERKLDDTSDHESPTFQTLVDSADLDCSEKHLPIYKFENEIVDKIAQNRITIIAGDTGCGKTTQVPQILYPYFKKMIISLPKKVAAISIAQRVAEELGEDVGGLVGYKVRWDEKHSKKTRILFVTDGILALECLNGNLHNYDLIVIDEFHERKMDYDFIISYFLTKQIPENPDLEQKLLLMSATINIKKYQKIFSAALIQIPISKFPNKIHYLKESNFDYEKEIIEIIVNICRKSDKGDILVFLPGVKEIEKIATQIEYTVTSSVEIIKLAGFYTLSNQMKVFEKMNKRKIILSTNIAESSITVNDLVYVIDSGQVRRCIIRGKAESLETVKISKSSSNQRAGRVGRVCPGNVYRMYTKNDYNIFEEDLEPDTVCGDITELVLKFLRANLDFTASMKLLGYKQIKYYKDACFKLMKLECMDENGKLTGLGRQVSLLPMKVELSKTILKSIELGVFNEVAIICAFLEVDRIFYDEPRFRDDIQKLLKIKSQGLGDHISYLNIFIEAFKANFSDKHCANNFIKISAIKEVNKLFNQIRKMFLDNLPPFKMNSLKKPNSLPKIIRSFCDGFRLNVAKKCDKSYIRETDRHIKVNIFGGSSLQESQPEMILFNKLLHTSQYLMKDCLLIPSKTYLDSDT